MALAHQRRSVLFSWGEGEGDTGEHLSPTRCCSTKRTLVRSAPALCRTHPPRLTSWKRQPSAPEPARAVIVALSRTQRGAAPAAAAAPL